MAVKDGFKDEQDCENCRHERLLPENNLAWEIIMSLEPGIIDGWGRVNFEGIEHGLNRFEITAPWERREIAAKINAYIKLRVADLAKKHG